MKRFLLLFLLAFAMWELQAQIPYFASTAGDGKLYGYTSLKLRPGINTQETYTTFQRHWKFRSFGYGYLYRSRFKLYGIPGPLWCVTE